MIEDSCYERKTCRVCESTELSTEFKLTPTPPGNNFVSENFSEDEKVFPLDLKFCSECKHIQLGHVVNPKFLFQTNYSYVSSTSSVFVDHLAQYADHIIKLLDLQPNALVVDIGSNDGTCLDFFKKKNLRVLGVDPAKEVSDIANRNGIETINDFFSSKLAKDISNSHGKADLITSHNACAHIDDLSGVISGVESLLKDDGVFVMEVGYFLDVFKNNWFDTVYHEHVDFHTVTPLVKLFARFDMKIVRVERISPQGGSIRVIVQKIKANKSVDSTVSELIGLEKELGLHSERALNDFQSTIDNLKDDFIKLIAGLKKDGKSIGAYGAPTKATTLCYHFNINNSDIDFIVDDNPLKQGLFSPGKHIPVHSPDKIYDLKPDYLVILAWNFATPIMNNHKHYLDIGSFILPMPIPRIVGK